MFSELGLFMLLSLISGVAMEDTMVNFVQTQKDLHSFACAGAATNNVLPYIPSV